MTEEDYGSYGVCPQSASERAKLETRVEDHRTVPCEACGTEGRIYEACWMYDRNLGFSYPDQCDVGPCPYCDGTGGEIILTEPITMEDLDGER